MRLDATYPPVRQFILLQVRYFGRFQQKMTNQTTSTELREMLRNRVATGGYRTLIDILLDGIGTFIQKITRRKQPLPHWYNALVFALISLLAGYSTSILLREYYSFRYDTLIFEISGISIAFFGLVSLHIYIRKTFATIGTKVIDTIETAKDLSDLQNWLMTVTNLGKHVIFSLVYTVISATFFLGLFFYTRGGFIGFGSTLLLGIVNFVAGMLIYYIIFFLELPLRLRRYEFKLFIADPSSSAMIGILSGIMTDFGYVIAILVAAGTLNILYSNLLTSITVFAIILVGWLPLIAIFVINQYALRTIIFSAKRKILDNIEVEIEAVRSQEQILSKETLEHLKHYMDLHDRIKSTRNWHLDWATGINFLNSLLLPLLALILSNLDKLLKVLP